MSEIERGYTYADMRLISMFARLEGAPATVGEIIQQLAARGLLSPAPAVTRKSQDALDSADLLADAVFEGVTQRTLESLARQYRAARQSTEEAKA